MPNDTLSQTIDAFLLKKVHPNGKRKYNQALGLFDQTEKTSRLHPYGLKQQDTLAEWLDLPLTGLRSNALAEALHQAIDDSIRNYTRQKQLPYDLYKSFCKFLEESYGIRVPIDWDAYNIQSNNREWQIIQMSTENKSIREMSERLMVSERQIRDDMNKLTDHGLTLLDRKIKISGLERSRGGIEFESTPHPILLLGNLMQVISLLESLRHYQQISQSDVPRITAHQIWQNLSNYAKTTIKNRIRDGVYDSELTWYENLDRPLSAREQDAFLTESAIAARNVQDQLIKCFKNGETSIIRYYDEKKVEQILTSVQIRNLQRETVSLKNMATSQMIELDTWQIISCTQQSR